MTGIPSGPVALEGSSLEIMDEIFFTEKSNDLTSVLESKSGKGTPSSLMLELAQRFEQIVQLCPYLK